MKPDNDQSRIELYLEGRMSAEDRIAFESDLDKDSELRATFNMYQLEKEALRLLSQEDLRAQMQEWKSEKKETAIEQEATIIRPNFRRRRLYRLSVAASVLLLIGFGFSFWQGSQYKNQGLSEDGFITTNRSDRGNIPAASPLIPVLDTLQTGAPQAALELLQALKDSPYRENALLLEGEIYYQQKDWDKAATAFKSLIDNGENITNIQKAHWNYANTLLAAGKEQEARDELGKMVQNEGHAYAKEAKLLLEKLNSFWRNFSF